MGVKFNADENVSSIEVTLGGAEYKIEKVTQRLLDEIGDMEQPEVGEKSEEKLLDRQLGKLFNVDPKVFIDVDVRAKVSALNFIQKEILGELKGDILGNPDGGDSTSSPK